MRVFLTLTALMVSFNAPSQTTFWNPDADANGLVGAADLLPFLELFGMPFSATPLYCQDTASFDAVFVYPQNEINVPLAQMIFASIDPNAGWGNQMQSVVLPTDSVPNGYRSTVVNLNIFGNGGYGLRVKPQNDQMNLPKIGRGQSRDFIHHNGQWYPTYAGSND